MNTIAKTANLKQDYVLEKLSDIYCFGVQHSPDKQALKQGKNILTFRQLENTSTILSNRLVNLGVEKNDRIVVLAEKRIEVGIIAPSIWKTSAIYVPLDASLPDQRLSDMLSSLQPKVVISSEEWHQNRAHLVTGYKTISYEDILDLVIAPEEVLIRKPESSERDIAYIIFTSGSTGNPKGVMISHSNLLDYFINHNDVFRFTKDSYCFSISPFHFDVSIEDTFLPLSRGSRVYLYKGLPMPTLILRILVDEKITHAIMVSTILSILTKAKDKIAKSDLSSLSLLMTGAEICSINVINFWKSSFPKLRVYNVYGPTETTIVTHCYEIPEADSKRSTIYPIGKGMRNVSSLLVNENGTIISQENVNGELLIGGTQVMKGYWKNPMETKKQLVKYGNVLYYKTGDICFIDQNQDYHFVGRLDAEIKLNGRRVNLVEIQTQLLKNSYIENVYVGVIKSDTDKKILVILVVNTDVDIQWLEALYRILEQSIPQYLLPSYIGLTGKNHLSSTGKSNGKALNELFAKAINNSKQYHRYYTISGNNFKEIDL